MTKDTAKTLDALPRLSRSELKARWQKCFGQPPPAKMNRDLLVRALIYRIQEEAYGGMRPATRRRLVKLASEFRANPNTTLGAAPRIKPGTRLLREWRGKTHTVTVAEDGFVYGNRRYGSLSVIAREITGTRWSGPLFFGLKSLAKNKGASDEG